MNILTNYMEEVAKLLGVRLNENFEVVQNTGIKLFRLKETGLYTFIVEDEFNAEWSKEPNDYNLRRLLTGELTIIKPPFRPKLNKPFWYIRWDINAIVTWHRQWENIQEDYVDLKCGNCFRTKEEAEANKFKIYEELTGKRWGEADD